ncbi:MAG TPA: helix-turn-helix transcriptional regulator [Gammaproteobacteria bacterium]|nr:helix-turn-helix transcriptional regulator [Gammaproteobacteria bacterium]
MARKNLLTSSPPYPVEQAIRRLGANLRTARLRRNFSIEHVAEKIGTGRRAVIDAEKGKASTSAAVYIALLWTYDLLTPMEAIADPALDREGSAHSAQRQRARTDGSQELDSDF